MARQTTARKRARQATILAALAEHGGTMTLLELREATGLLYVSQTAVTMAEIGLLNLMPVYGPTLSASSNFTEFGRDSVVSLVDTPAQHGV